MLALSSTTLCPGTKSLASVFDARGCQFIGIDHFSTFKRVMGTNQIQFTSQVIETAINWDELIVSWNVDLPAEAMLRVEARGIYRRHSTNYYVMGLWSGNPAKHSRESVRGQEDEDGTVSTDTLILREPCRKLQIRLTIFGDTDRRLKLKFLGLSLHDTRSTPSVLSPNRTAWGKCIPVPERSQMAYPNGDVLCSPTTVSMLMSYWSGKLHRAELDADVPEVASEVYDPHWEGTGNWVFNTAYAGSQHGIRAYVTRLSDVSELEDWVARGIPIGLSVCYNRLRGIEGRSSGHLVVCVGFTEQGDVILNDPGTRRNVRKTFPRANLIKAWAHSKNTAYLIYPEKTRVPKDRFHHWASSRRVLL